MAQAVATDTRRPITIADLNTEIDDEPRVLDVVLGEGLGFARPRAIRQIVERNTLELQGYGSLATRRGKSRGQHFTEYFLNEPQALLICMFSNTARAAEVRKMLIDVFMEYRRGTVAKPTHVREHDRRTSVKVDDAIRLKKNIDRLENIANGIAPARQILTAMVIDGEPVVVDVADYAVPDGERAVVVRHDGSLAVWPVSQMEGGYRGGGQRSAYGPRVQNGIGTVREACVIVGRVIERPAEGARTIEHAPHYRGRRTLFRDEILRLLGTGLSNRQISQQTGATYQTVTHWRRWAADNRPALLGGAA